MENTTIICVIVMSEPSPDRPADHLGGDQQIDGDPEGVVRDALGL